jgi:hypothetical protein
MILLMAETCRYKIPVKINVFPDIEWEMAFTFALEQPLAYAHSGKKTGFIFYEAQEMARQSGYDRYQLSRGGKAPFEFSLSLKSTYNNGKIENEHALSFSKKLSDSLGIFTKLKDMAQRVIKSTGGAAKKIPGKPAFSFEVQSPVLGAILSWKNVENQGKVSNAGTVSLTADPLIGAEFTIDLLAAGSSVHPIVKVIQTGVNIGLDLLGGYFILEAKFYGNLEITIEAFKFNSSNLALSQEPAMIKGKMGASLILSLKVDGEIEAIGYKVKMKFSADAEVNAYFGGTAQLAYDRQGLYADCVGKFSGLIFSAKIEVVINGYTRKIDINKTVWESEDVPLGKIYLINKNE